MKPFLSISLAVLILITSMSSGVTFLVFKIEQNEIIEKWCINKDKPQMHCDGKCYLKQRFVEQHDKNQSKAPVPVSDQLKITWISHPAASFNDRQFISPNSHQYFYAGLHSQPFYHSLFRPPESAAA
ncbi:MAG: hypothetical protein ACE5FF_13935 [Saprospiraceae bacterium]